MLDFLSVLFACPRTLTTCGEIKDQIGKMMGRDQRPIPPYLSIHAGVLDGGTLRLELREDAVDSGGREAIKLKIKDQLPYLANSVSYIFFLLSAARATRLFFVPASRAVATSCREWIM